MPTQAKICGLSTQATLDAAISGGASHVGFVFFAPSPRNVALGEAAALAERTPAAVGKVGVFVDPDNALLDAAIHAGGLNALQLHKTDLNRIAAIKARYPIEVWPVVAVRTRADLAAAAPLAPLADRILYDAKTPDEATLPGGMGLRFDWALLDGFAHPRPWALSGGLDAENVADAVTVTRAPLVDVSSGVESAPGVKDVDKIARFLLSIARS